MVQWDHRRMLPVHKPPTGAVLQLLTDDLWTPVPIGPNFFTTETNRFLKHCEFDTAIQPLWKIVLDTEFVERSFKESLALNLLKDFTCLCRHGIGRNIKASFTTICSDWKLLIPTQAVTGLRATRRPLDDDSSFLTLVLVT